MLAPFSRSTLACAILACSLPAFANDTVQLQNTVVSASGFEQKIIDAPASITVVSQEDLQKKPYVGLADALRDIEGVDVGATQDKTGNISVSMRGLPAKYTLVLIDGRRQSDIGNIAPNDFGNNQFMYIPPMDAIERIEVVRGPMSTLYGADAMGGVINIITKKVRSEWGGTITHGSTFQESPEFGDSRKTDFYASGPLVENLLGLSVRGAYLKRDESSPKGVEGLRNADNSPYSDTSGFSRNINEADIWNAGLTLNLTPNDVHDFQLQYDVAEQKYDNSKGQSGTLDGVTNESLLARQGPRVGYRDELGFERHQFVLAHTANWDIGTLESSLTYSTSENTGRTLPLSASERREFLTIKNSTLSQAQKNELYALEFLPRPDRVLKNENYIFDTKFSTQVEDHYLTIGGQFLRSDMEDGVFGLEQSNRKKGVTVRHEQSALFIEDNWDLFDPFTLTLGLRADDHNVYGSHLSPRAYGVYRLNDLWTLKGGVSTGYKTPTPDELTPGVTGFGSQGLTPLIGSPDLEPETSTNYEIAAYYDSGDFSANATAFLTKFKDKIETSDAINNCFNSNGTQVLFSNCAALPDWADIYTGTFSQKVNIDEAEVRGIELAANWYINDQWKLKGNYTYTKSEIKSGVNKGNELTNTPRHMLNTTLAWLPIDDLELSLVSEYKDKRFRDIGTETAPTPAYYDAYTLWHLGATYQATESITLFGRINNLFDEDLGSRTCLPAKSDANLSQPDTWACSSDYSVVDSGRSYWLSASYRF